MVISIFIQIVNVTLREKQNLFFGLRLIFPNFYTNDVGPNIMSISHNDISNNEKT